VNILQYCPVYRPSVGGLEFVVYTLAKEFVALGHTSRILTLQKGECSDDSSLGVIRRGGLQDQIAALRWADAVICHQDSLRLAWPLLGGMRPALMMVNITPQHRRWPASRLMRRIAVNCVVYGSSEFLAEQVKERLGVPCAVLPNPYDAKRFYPAPAGAPRTIDFAFVGRMVHLKGPDLFVKSLARVAASGAKFSAVLIGGGSERSNLEQLIAANSLEDSVKLVGQLDGEQIAEVLRDTRCLVVPSRYEPFGIVALEGRACGCKLVVTGTGGLPAAAGRNALIVPEGDVDAMADGMMRTLRGLRRNDASVEVVVDRELEKHEPRSVAKAYLGALAALNGAR